MIECKDVLVVVREWCYLFHPLDSTPSFSKFIGFDWQPFKWCVVTYWPTHHVDHIPEVLSSCHITLLVGDLFHSLIIVIESGDLWKVRGGWDHFILVHFRLGGRAVVLNCSEGKSESGSLLIVLWGVPHLDPKSELLNSNLVHYSWPLPLFQPKSWFCCNNTRTQKKKEKHKGDLGLRIPIIGLFLTSKWSSSFLFYVASYFENLLCCFLSNLSDQAVLVWLPLSVDQIRELIWFGIHSLPIKCLLSSFKSKNTLSSEVTDSWRKSFSNIRNLKKIVKKENIWLIYYLSCNGKQIQYK